jgi:tRNA(Ile)-lysidine synthase
MFHSAAHHQPEVLTVASARALLGMDALATVPALAVAVSGGPDSMALLWLLSQMDGPAIHALTVDHALRAGSAAEAVQVGAWVAGWPRVHHHVLIRGASAPGRVMERARDDRYEMMATWCHDHNIAHLLTAHHRDDQAETFLFRLAKGSGLDGLGGIQAQTNYNDHLILHRPLLTVGKDILVATCAAHDIPFVRDPTNDNPAFARNRLRAAMDILAAEGLNTKRLALTALRLGRARRALDYYARRAYDTALLLKDDHQAIMKADLLRAEPEETRRRVLLLAMAELDKSRGYGPRMEALEDLTTALFTDSDFTRATLGGFIFAYKRKADQITVARE